MKRSMRILFSALVLAFFCAGQVGAAELKVGDKAPEFKLMGSDGKEYTISQFKGKSAVVLNFFPKAFTAG